MNHLEESKGHFKNRHIGPNEEETREMLSFLGLNSLDELIDQTIPQDIKATKPLNLKEPVSEFRLLKDVQHIADKNQQYRSYIGMGYYNTITPGVIKRNILENPGWYTSYTPYQPEISQGRLEALLNFQTMITDMTGMEIANASLLDEATAAAEAMTLMHSINGRKKGNFFFVTKDIFPQTLEVLQTRAKPLGIEIIQGQNDASQLDGQFFGALLQYPDNNGEVKDLTEFCTKAKENGTMITVAADIMSLALLTPPGEFGADVVVGSTQRLGIPLGYGGPHAAYFATKDEYKRKVPGRMIGVSYDSQGKKAFRMALQTREQHIKREKATSNICTAQVLLAVMAGMYASYHGAEGITKIAKRINALTKFLSKTLTTSGFTQLNSKYFDTIKLKVTPDEKEKIRQKTEENQINLRYFDDEHIGISLDETSSYSEVLELAQIIANAAGKKTPSNTEEIAQNATAGFEGPLQRKSEFLTHPVFNMYHSETEMLRYLKYLENKDLSLTHSMIPLGSCTMKLNATTEMEPVTWPEFGDVHPFVPTEQAKGYQQIFKELSEQLREITGFQEVSLQPNSGAQGEYTGLMVIREYLKEKGEGHRNVALIPSSAHGTNPASANMAGMKVVVVKCDDRGNIDIEDLKKKAEKHKEELAAIMVTYPSTHGVFESNIREVCQIIHDNGGQVYLDGANLNAKLGLTSPGIIGADVCHLNLHKTFCIPHGGGGPGMGPIAVAGHLAPFLPKHPVVPTGGEKGISAVSAAPWGSPSILLISYIYMRLMGSEGLTEASKYAILNTNYIKERLKDSWQILYKGENGNVAHEMVVDTRDLKNSAGIEVEDIAKRLMDYGFHAPTMSWPVPGTLMVEPTESESKPELDRFCKAMISIREEIDEIAKESSEDPKSNVLKNAPHTMEMIATDNWPFNYSREKAAFPLQWLRSNKFWPAAARIDSTYGDRNLVCVCPPLEDYMEHEELIEE